MKSFVTLTVCTALAAIACLASGRPAAASGDFGCEPSFKLLKSAYTGCDNSAVIGPANDTRVNLILLMHDIRKPAPLHGGKPKDEAQRLVFFSWDDLLPQADPQTPRTYEITDGDVCQSNGMGAEEFLTALKSATVPEPERATLAAVRAKLKAKCADKGAPAQADSQVRSPEGRAFLSYLQGAADFYAGDFDGAGRSFASITKPNSAWLKEAARYMLGRVEVNRAQVGAFDEYGAIKANWHANPAVINATLARFDDYLRDYPNGRYADSARGLKRRAYWLGGQTNRLTAEYARLMINPGQDLDDFDVAQEIDNKLLDDSGYAGGPRSGVLGPDVKDPLILAVNDLYAMRSASFGNDPQPVISRADLEAQRPLFANRKDLFDLLLATRALYIDKQPAEVLRLIPDAARQKSFTAVEFSRQVLRGMALEALKDRNARGFWVEMAAGATGPNQRAAVELAIAHHDERANALHKVFEAGSLVTNPTLREILIRNSAGPDLLRAEATNTAVPARERQRALHVLLYKELSRGAYANFVKDLAIIPADLRNPPKQEPTDYENAPPPLWQFVGDALKEDFKCPPLVDTAKTLAAQPVNTTARLCVAEFLRLASYDGTPLDVQPDKSELGGAPTQFPGKVYSRLEVYKQIIADAKAPAADKAYALYRAVWCYGPSGNNSCGGIEVPVAQRKAWFQQLKKDYASSEWAKDLKYYW